MGRPRADANTVGTRQRLLEAAVGVFAARGFSAATLAEIAAGAGVTRPSLLHHFETKDHLYAAALEQVFARIRDAVDAGVGLKGSLEVRLQGLIVGFAAFVDADPDTSRLLLRAIVADGEPTTRELVLAQAGPVLDEVVAAVIEAGALRLDRANEVRRLLMMVIVDLLCRSAAGVVAPRLWGEVEGSTSQRHTTMVLAALRAEVGAGVTRADDVDDADDVDEALTVVDGATLNSTVLR